MYLVAHVSGDDGVALRPLIRHLHLLQGRQRSEPAAIGSRGGRVNHRHAHPGVQLAMYAQETMNRITMTQIASTPR